MDSISLLLLLLLCSYHCVVASPGDEQSYKVLDLNPKAVCSKPNGGGTATVTLNHRYGPCSPATSGEKTPTNEELLRRNELRAQLIQWKLSKNNGTATGDGSSSKAAVSVTTTLGSSLGTLEYVISVGIGSPAVTQTVAIDTGSDVSWVQCKPCPVPSSCHAQMGKLFDPAASTTYAAFPCSAAACARLGEEGGGCDATSRCRYIVRYGDGSNTAGTYGSDTLTLSPASVFAGGAVVDSGTVVTRLPPTAYAALSSAFRAGMRQYPRAQRRGILDTCFDFSGLDSVRMPRVRPHPRRPEHRNHRERAAADH